MKRIPVFIIWIVSFILLILFAESMNTIFWASFAVFAIISIYIEKNSKILEREEDSLNHKEQ